MAATHNPPASAPDDVLTGVAARAVGGRTVGAMVLAATAQHEGVAIRHHAEGGWQEMNYDELGSRARAIACGLLGLGILPRDHVAILSSTRAEWTILDCAALAAGAVVVPIYSTNSPGECRYVLDHSDTRLVFVEDADQLAKVLSVRDQLPGLQYVVALEGTGADVLSLEALVELGADVDEARLHQIRRSSGPTTSRRSSTRRARPGRRRGA
jgi:long-chain acyl-CoA synthetase